MEEEDRGIIITILMSTGITILMSTIVSDVRSVHIVSYLSTHSDSYMLNLQFKMLNRRKHFIASLCYASTLFKVCGLLFILNLNYFRTQYVR